MVRSAFLLPAFCPLSIRVLSFERSWLGGRSGPDLELLEFVKNAQTCVLKVIAHGLTRIFFILALKSVDDCQVLLASWNEPLRHTPKIEHSCPASKSPYQIRQNAVSASFGNHAVQQIIEIPMISRVCRRI